MNELLLEPLKYYEKVGAAEHEQNVAAHFDALLQKSGVNVEENRATAKKYRAEMLTLEKLRDNRSKKKALRGFLIFLAIVGVGLGIGSFWFFKSSALYGALALGGGVLLLVGSILLIKKVLNPAIKEMDTLIAKHEVKAKEFLDEAERQVAPLNALFKNDDTLRLIEKTIPEFSFDERFSIENQALFAQQYDFVVNDSAEVSVLDTLSGRFMKNPFVYCKNKIHQMGLKTYHGTRVISWQQRYTDKDGHTRTRTVTQTLHASVIKPKPEYYQRKSLHYGCQAAPELSFSREPKHSERLSENERERKVRRGEKKLKKKAEKALARGKNFQEMANSEFDVLFGASDRDHEVQFRLMYTPLAQCSTVDLLTSRVGYGDDFYFQKRRRCNVITSEHAQQWLMNCSAAHYYSYDVDEIKRKFFRFNNEYFKSVFFDFAPCFAVPAYMEEPSVAMEKMNEESQSYYTSYEHEVLANALGASILAHSASQTEAILKTHFLGCNGIADRVEVNAYSYDTIARVDYIPKLGGDGRLHDVPVPWVEYVPLQRTTQIELAPLIEPQEREEKGLSEQYARAVVYHGIAAWLAQE